MDIGAIITLVALGVTIIGIGIWLLIFGGKPKLPKGKKVTYKEGGLETILVYRCAAKHNYKNLVKHLHYVHIVSRSHFRDAKFVKSDVMDKCKTLVVYFLDDKLYDIQKQTYADRVHKSSAYIDRLSRKVYGPSLPMAVIRSKYFDLLWESGEPLVHELCHAYLDDYIADDQDHTDPRVWQHVSGEAAIQSKAVHEILFVTQASNSIPPKAV